LSIMWAHIQVYHVLFDVVTLTKFADRYRSQSYVIPTY
jgi:hypothetical protein